PQTRRGPVDHEPAAAQPRALREAAHPRVDRGAAQQVGALRDRQGERTRRAAARRRPPSAAPAPRPVRPPAGDPRPGPTAAPATPWAQPRTPRRHRGGRGPVATLAREVAMPDHEVELLITNARIVSGGALEHGWIRFAGGRVLARGTGTPPTQAGEVVDAAG